MSYDSKSIALKAVCRHRLMLACLSKSGIAPSGSALPSPNGPEAPTTANSPNVVSSSIKEYIGRRSCGYVSYHMRL